MNQHLDVQLNNVSKRRIQQRPQIRKRSSQIAMTKLFDVSPRLRQQIHNHPMLVQKLNVAMNKALAGEMRERLIADGIVPGGGSPAEFAKFQADDIATSGKIIADKKITLE
jgi:hypothetical protein